MLKFGIRKGDKVAILAYNSHYYPISLIGLGKIGAVQVPLNYMLNADEISYIVNHSGAKIFLVEDALYQHPAVEEVAVIGLPDPKWIEVVTAVVVPKKGAILTDKDIIAFAKDKLAGFKCPKKVVVVDKLPKNPSGKILKRELKAELAK